MIFTLYSYKGGVGRSMALANVAHWLYLRGLTVLMVDWDLEAPGLETFFYRSADKIDLVRSHLGVIDLLTAYCRQFPYLSGPSSWDSLPPVESYLCEIEPEVFYQRSIEKPSGRLRLLGAGWRSGTRFVEYAEAVHAFDWAGFYTKFRGQEYFNWFRDQLLSLADVVLVDSRTGITEMGGVCTRHLADVVVSFCAPNLQNLQGVLEMADSFQSEAVTEARGRRLEVLILPARIDDQDSAGYSAFRSDFVRDAERFTPAVLRKWKRSPWDLAIPYKAQYSYGEKLATGVEGSNEMVEAVYRQLATHIAFFSPQDSKLWNACLSEMKPLAAAAGIDLSTPLWREAEAVVAQFNPQELVEAQRVLLRLVHLSPQSPSLDSRRRSTHAELLLAGSAGVLDRLRKSGVIASVEEEDAPSPESFELAQESVVTNWPRLREWIEAQRPLLLWRQDVAAQAAKWMARDRDPALLLRGTPLREAVANSPEAHLNAAERLFVETSLTAEVERRRAEHEQTEQAKRAEEEAAEAKRKVEQQATEVVAKSTRKTRWLSIGVAALLLVVATLAWYVLRQQKRSELPSLSAQSQLLTQLTVNGGLPIAFSPDGKRIVTFGADKTVRMWDAETGKQLLTFSGHDESFTNMAWSPDGKRLATGSIAGAEVWDGATGKELLALSDHGEFVVGVAWSPDGKRLATASTGTGSLPTATAEVWDVTTGEKLLTIVGSVGFISSVAWSPDGKRLATGSIAGAEVWDGATGKELLTLSGDSVASIAWSPDGKRLATGSFPAANVWDAATGQQLLTLHGHSGGFVFRVAWSPDGKRLATGSAGAAEVWDAATGKVLLTLGQGGLSGLATSVAWSPDGKRLATGSSAGAQVWDAATGKVLLTLSGHG